MTLNKNGPTKLSLYCVLKKSQTRNYAKKINHINIQNHSTQDYIMEKSCRYRKMTLITSGKQVPKVMSADK